MRDESGAYPLIDISDQESPDKHARELQVKLFDVKTAYQDGYQYG
jgi:hypothetical protein